MSSSSLLAEWARGAFFLASRLITPHTTKARQELWQNSLRQEDRASLGGVNRFRVFYEIGQFRVSMKTFLSYITESCCLVSSSYINFFETYKTDILVVILFNAEFIAYRVHYHHVDHDSYANFRRMSGAWRPLLP